MSIDHIWYIVIKKQVQYYWYDSIIKQLLGQVGSYWVIYLIKSKFAPILFEVYNYVGYLGSKIVLNYLEFRIFWPKIAFDIYKYILNGQFIFNLFYLFLFTLENYVS